MSTVDCGYNMTPLDGAVLLALPQRTQSDMSTEREEREQERYKYRERGSKRERERE